MPLEVITDSRPPWIGRPRHVGQRLRYTSGGYADDGTMEVMNHRGGRTTIRRGRRPRVELLEDRMLLSTFTVTDTGDDVNVTGSLRYAITQSNATGPGPNTIDFDISGAGVQTIAPGSPLPTITVPVTIDGTTQPGYSGLPLIVIDGSQAGRGTFGLDVSAGNSTIHGLAVDNFVGNGSGGGSGIVLGGSERCGHRLLRRRGRHREGVAAGNGNDGIECLADDITIGGAAAEAPGNVISASTEGAGIAFTGAVRATWCKATSSGPTRPAPWRWAITATASRSRILRGS